MRSKLTEEKQVDIYREKNGRPCFFTALMYQQHWYIKSRTSPTIVQHTKHNVCYTIFRLYIYVLWKNMKVNNSVYIVLSVHWQPYLKLICKLAHKKKSPCARFLTMTRQTDRQTDRQRQGERHWLWENSKAWGYSSRRQAFT